MSEVPPEIPTYARTADIVAADVGGETVLLHTERWTYFEFDRVGTSIWELLETPRTLPSLVEALMSKYEVDEAQCAADTRDFLAQMIEQGIVVAR